jgi:hypothetical protein
MTTNNHDLIFTITDNHYIVFFFGCFLWLLPPLALGVKLIWCKTFAPFHSSVCFLCLLPLFASSICFFYLLLLFASSICFFYLLLLFAFFGCFLWLLPSFCFLHFANPMNGHLYDHLDVLLQHHQNTLNVIYGNTYQVFVLLLSTGTSHLEMGRGKAQSCKSTTCLVIQETPSPSPSPSPAPDMPASPALVAVSKMVAKPKKVLDANAEIQEFWAEMNNNCYEYWQSDEVLRRMFKETLANPL